jgi:hypothetical protein
VSERPRAVHVFLIGDTTLDRIVEPLQPRSRFGNFFAKFGKMFA